MAQGKPDLGVESISASSLNPSFPWPHGEKANKGHTRRATLPRAPAHLHVGGSLDVKASGIGLFIGCNYYNYYL